MIKKTTLTLGFFLLALVNSMHAVSPKKGEIIAVNLDGYSWLSSDASGQSFPLHSEQKFEQGYTISTGPESSCSLYFSNGTHIHLSQNTSIAVDQFYQDPYQESSLNSKPTQYLPDSVPFPAHNYLAFQTEPSNSKTALELLYGEATVSVQQLQPNSSFTITCPAGTASGSDTQFRIAYYQNPTDGSFQMKTTTFRGKTQLTSDSTFTKLTSAHVATISGHINYHGQFHITSSEQAAASPSQMAHIQAVLHSFSAKPPLAEQYPQFTSPRSHASTHIVASPQSSPSPRAETTHGEEAYFTLDSTNLEQVFNIDPAHQ